MAAYVSRRLILALFTIFAISALSFFIIELPEGDLATKRLDRTMDYTTGPAQAQEIAAELRRYLQLDKPVYVRYFIWLGGLLRGDLGRSFGSPSSGLMAQKPVRQVVEERLWLTVALTGFTILVTWTFAIPVGIYSAVRQHSVGDYVFTLAGFTGLAVPDFLLGLVLMYIGFAYFNQSVGGLFSADYQSAPWDFAKAYDLIKHLIIPAVVLGTSGTAGLIRVMRNNLLDELAKPYVVTARAKGSAVLEAGDEVPRARGDQPAHQHGGLPVAVADQRQRNRFGGAEPADHRAGAADGHPGRGRVPGGVRDTDARDADGAGHAGLGHPAGRRGPTHQVHGAVVSTTSRQDAGP